MASLFGNTAKPALLLTGQQPSLFGAQPQQQQQVSALQINSLQNILDVCFLFFNIYY